MALVEGAAIVAGAGPGVSGHLARLLAGEGRPLGLLGRDPDVLDGLRSEALELGVPCETALVDLADDPTTRVGVTDLVARLGPVALVHFNPSAYRAADALQLTPAQLADDMAVGVGALLSVVQAARPAMVSGSRVSVTGSMAADRPSPAAASLGVQKAAVRNLVHSLDSTLAEHDIRAVSVTVRGTLSAAGPFAHAAVARAIREALDQDASTWRAELSYPEDDA